MLHKSCSVTNVKAGVDDGLEEGQFTATVSVFGNKDSYGDVVVKGAFADSLAEWKASGNPIPVYWSHRMDDPDYNIGHVLDAAETEKALEIRGQLDLESPKAKQVYRLMKGRRVNNFSYAYDIIDAGPAKSEALGDYFELRKLKIFETGPTPIGANQETELLAVKSAAAYLAEEAKSGRVLAAKHIDSLRAAQEAIVTVIQAAEGSNDQEKASATTPAKVEEPETAKTEEPTKTASVDAVLAVLSIQEREC